MTAFIPRLGTRWLEIAAILALFLVIHVSANETDLATSSDCYYNYNHYSEGDRILTNEPCLNCTCHNKMLMCYLKVCPFTKPIGQDCTIEKREDQCCPIITCPEVPVELDHSSAQTSTDLATHQNHGCSIDDQFYPEGAQIPGNPKKPCELCYCIRNMTSCVMQECTLHVDGCRPIYNKGVCCPVRYDCAHDDEIPLMLEDQTTTEAPSQGFVITTTMAPAQSTDCYHNDVRYIDGEMIETDQPCEHCYCMRGDIVCAVQECKPLEMHGKNCTAKLPGPGECCPSVYECESDMQSTTLSDALEPSATTLGYKDIHDEAILTTTPGAVSSSEHLEKDAAVTTEEAIAESTSRIDESENEIHDKDYDHMTVKPARSNFTAAHPEGVDDRAEIDESTTLLSKLDDVAATTILSESGPASDEQITTVLPIGAGQPQAAEKETTESEGILSNLYTTIKSIVEFTTTLSPLHEQPPKMHVDEEEPFLSNVIPGEGDCLDNGVSYGNNTVVPTRNACEESCLCHNSIVQCENVKCAPMPPNAENCKIMHEEGLCCPSYHCESMEFNTGTPPTHPAESQVVHRDESEPSVDSTTAAQAIEESESVEPQTNAIDEKLDSTTAALPQAPISSKFDDTLEVKPEMDVSTEPAKLATETSAPAEIESTTAARVHDEEVPSDAIDMKEADKFGEQPAQTEGPIESDEQPAKTETPIESEEPAKTETPIESEEPAKTETPIESEEPAKTEEPIKSEEPIKPEIITEGAATAKYEPESTTLPETIGQPLEHDEEHKAPQEEIEPEIVQPTTAAAAIDEQEDAVTTQAPSRDVPAESELSTHAPVEKLHDEIIAPATEIAEDIEPTTQAAEGLKEDEEIASPTTQRAQLDMDISTESQPKPIEGEKEPEIVTQGPIVELAQPESDVSTESAQPEIEMRDEITTAQPDLHKAPEVSDVSTEALPEIPKERDEIVTTERSEQAPEIPATEQSEKQPIEPSLEQVTTQQSAEEPIEQTTTVHLAEPESPIKLPTDIDASSTEKQKEDEVTENLIPDSSTEHLDDEIATDKVMIKPTEKIVESVPLATEKEALPESTTLSAEKPEHLDESLAHTTVAPASIDTKISDETTPPSAGEEEIAPTTVESKPSAGAAIEPDVTEKQQPEINEITSEHVPMPIEDHHTEKDILEPATEQQPSATDASAPQIVDTKDEQVTDAVPSQTEDANILIDAITTESTETKAQEPSSSTESAVLQEQTTLTASKVNLGGISPTDFKEGEVMSPDDKQELDVDDSAAVTTEKPIEEIPSVTISGVTVPSQQEPEEVKPEQQTELSPSSEGEKEAIVTEQPAVTDKVHDVQSPIIPEEKEPISTEKAQPEGSTELPKTQEDLEMVTEKDIPSKQEDLATEKAKDESTTLSSEPSATTLSPKPVEHDASLEQVTEAKIPEIEPSTGLPLEKEAATTVASVIAEETPKPASDEMIPSEEEHVGEEKATSAAPIVTDKAHIDEATPSIEQSEQTTFGTMTDKPADESEIKQEIPMPTTEAQPKPELESGSQMHGDEIQPEGTEGPKVPELTESPKLPEITEAPKTPELTEEPKLPEITEAPKSPEITEKPSESTEASKSPELEEEPKVPELTESPKLPEQTESPKLPEIPESPATTEPSKQEEIAAATTSAPFDSSNRIGEGQETTVKSEQESQPIVTEATVSSSEAPKDEQQPHIELATTESANIIDLTTLLNKIHDESISPVETTVSSIAEEATTQKQQEPEQPEISHEPELPAQEPTQQPESTSTAPIAHDEKLDSEPIEGAVTTEQAAIPDESAATTQKPAQIDETIDATTSAPAAAQEPIEPDNRVHDVPAEVPSEVTTGQPIITDESTQGVSEHAVEQQPAEGEFVAMGTQPPSMDEQTTQQDIEKVTESHIPAIDTKGEIGEIDATTQKDESEYQHPSEVSVPEIPIESSSQESEIAPIVPETTAYDHEAAVTTSEPIKSSEPSHDELPSAEISTEHIESAPELEQQQTTAKPSLFDGTTIKSVVELITTLHPKEPSQQQDDEFTTPAPMIYHPTEHAEIDHRIEPESGSSTTLEQEEVHTTESIPAVHDVMNKTSDEGMQIFASPPESINNIPLIREPSFDELTTKLAESFDTTTLPSSLLTSSHTERISDSTTIKNTQNEITEPTPQISEGSLPVDSSGGQHESESEQPSYPSPGFDSGYGNVPSPSYPDDEYTDEEEPTVFGPGTCRYGGKLYVSAQQIPRDDPCDFCFCFRSDIICLQQSCPPPINGCHEEPIQGFCCPRYECPVSMALVLNSTTTTTTTLPPYLSHLQRNSGKVTRSGCQVQGQTYKIGERVTTASGPCIDCICGGDGQMKCDPKVCTPEPMLRQMIASAKRR